VVVASPGNEYRMCVVRHQVASFVSDFFVSLSLSLTAAAPNDVKINDRVGFTRSPNRHEWSSNSRNVD
jgi:hypothetical protein